MELIEKIKFLRKKVSEIEQGLYIVEHQIIPRYEADKKILADMRQELIRNEAEFQAVPAEPEKKEESKKE